MPLPSNAAPSSGGTLVSTDGRALVLRETALSGSLRGGYGRVVVSQTFVNPHAEPLRVTYQLPLPSDGAVAGFRFRIGELEIVGEVDRKDRARERFEEAILSGRTAALLEQERSSLFSQEVGNIPPGAEVVVSIRIDQKLRWIDDAGAGHGGWEWRFPTVVAPRYLGEPGRVDDARRVAVAVADRPPAVRTSLRLSIAEPLAEGTRPRSSSHGLLVVPKAGTHAVELADSTAALDRDLVVRWAVAAADVGVALDAARPVSGHAAAEYGFGLLTIVPPRAAATSVPRDLIVLLDTSGSMHGEPLAQAQHVTCALIDSLGDEDTLELIEFSSATRRWHRRERKMNARQRGKAIAWVRALSAGGGTEMRTGIMEALAGLRPEAQRQVVVITDGLIGFEQEIVAEVAHRRPRGCRVHTVGIGSAVNRSLTTPVARAGSGLEVICGIGEDPERAAARLLARTRAPIVVDLELSGDALVGHAPAQLPDLFAGAPALVSAKLRAQGGTLRVSGRTDEGTWTRLVQVPSLRPGEGRSEVVSAFGREQVEDLELSRAAGDGSLDPLVTQVGLDFQISTRLTSWVAVTSEATVDPRDPTRRDTVPQALPHGMSVEGLGLRAPVAAGPGQGFASSGAMPMAPSGAVGGGGVRRSQERARSLGAVPSRPMAKKGRGGSKMDAEGGAPPPPPRSAPSPVMADEADDFALEEQAAPPAKEAEKVAQAELARDVDKKAKLAPSTWRGRLVSYRDGRVIVEVVVDAATAWALVDDLQVQFADGTTAAAAWDHGATTRPGQLLAGTTIRLVIDLPPGRGEPVALHLGTDRRITLAR
jgi:Ca-activated chloride channel family protein